MAKRKKSATSTAPTVTKKKSATDLEVVVFEDRRKRLKAKPSGQDVEEASASKSFDFKKARHEVFKFALQGMGEDQKTTAKDRHLKSLGAIPRKSHTNKVVNYKVLTRDRIKEKEEDRQERQEGNQRFSLSKMLGAKKSSVVKRKRDPNAPKGGIDYQVGKFKNGVQIVNKRQLMRK